MYPRVLGSMHFEELPLQSQQDQVVRSLSKDPSAMRIYKWQRGMCRVFPNKLTE